VSESESDGEWPVGTHRACDLVPWNPPLGVLSVRDFVSEEEEMFCPRVGVACCRLLWLVCLLGKERVMRNATN